MSYVFYLDSVSGYFVYFITEEQKKKNNIMILSKNSDDNEADLTNKV